MARMRMVTRTVEVATVEVMTVNTQTAAVKNITVEVGGGITDPNALLKVVRKSHETNVVKCVAIVNTTMSEVLYGMPEEEFIRLAKILPSRSKSTEN